MTLTKSPPASLFDIQSVASNSVVVGTAKDVHLAYEAAVRIRMGRGTGTGFTTAPVFRLEGTGVVAPTADDWLTLAPFSPALGASIGNQAVSGTEAIGQTVVTLAAGTNFAGGDYVFFHNTTIANSEWSHVVSVSSADLTLEEAIVRAQTGSTARNQAEIYGPYSLDVLALYWIRLVADCHGTGQALILQADYALTTGL